MKDAELESVLNRLVDKLAERVPIKKLAYTAAEAAEVISCSEPFIYKLVREGELQPVVRLGNRGIRIPAQTLEEFVARGGIKEVC